MLSAINLDHQALFQAGEVHDISAYRALAAKSNSSHMTMAQLVPESALRVGHHSTQLPGEIPPLAVAHPCESLMVKIQA